MLRVEDDTHLIILLYQDIYGGYVIGLQSPRNVLFAPQPEGPDWRDADAGRADHCNHSDGGMVAGSGVSEV